MTFEQLAAIAAAKKQRAIAEGQQKARQGQTVEVELPDGTIAEFPAGISRADMAAALKSYWAAQQPAPEQGQPVFEMQGPDGQTYEVQAPDSQSAARATQSFSMEQLAAIAAAKKQRAAQTQTNLFEQSTSGINEGIAGMLGAPVDLMAGALNMGAKGINAVAGTNLPSIENPVGGSGTFRDLLSPTISEVGPQTTAQRYGRRIGQEVGAASIPGGVMMRGAAAPIALAGTELASALGAGLAGQTSQEIAPGNATADMIASMAGGLSPVVAALTMRPRPQAPTLDSLKQRQAAAYSDVDASQARLGPMQRQGLIDQMRGRTDAMDMDEFLHPRANRTMGRMDSLEPSPRIADVEQKRRLVGRDVAGSLDPSEAMIGQGMKDEIDAYLKGLADNGGLGPDASATLGRLQDGREMTQRIKKAGGVVEALTKAERRAASSGTGGNEVNATRQNIRAMLDNPKQSRAFSAVERELMESIVRGTPTQNALRLAGRFSPTSGALSAMGGLASGASFGPLGVLPSVIGYGAKAGAEALTKRQIENLLQTIRNGGPLAAKALNSTETRGVVAALLAGGASAPEPN